MPLEDEMQVAVFYKRLPTLEVAAIPVEMGGGEGNLVRLWACHWNIEFTDTRDGPVFSFAGGGLSSNPEHETGPGIGFQDFQSDKSIYARAIWIYAHDGIGDTTSFATNKVIPLYGLVRPRRQLMMLVNLWGTLEEFNGFGLEVYYTPFSVPLDEREEVNRKYGKYRRS